MPISPLLPLLYNSVYTHLKQALNGVNKWSVATPPRWYTEHAQVCGQ